MLVTVHKARKAKAREGQASTKQQAQDWKEALQYEPLFRQAYHTLVSSIKQDKVFMGSINQAVRAPKATPGSILSAIPFFDKKNPDTFAVWNRFAGKYRAGYGDIIEAASRAEAKRHGWGARARVRVRKAPIPINEASAEFIRTRALARAVEMSDTMKMTITQVLADAFDEGLHPDGIMRNIQGSVGLTSNQWARVAKREAIMRLAGYGEASIIAESLKMQQVIRGQRAEAIARTETLDAQTQGKLDTWTKADQEGLMPPGTKKQWEAVNDTHTDDLCKQLEAQGPIPVNEPYDTPSGPVQGPTAHPMCRCTLSLVFPED